MFGHVQSVRPHQGDIFEKLQFKYVTEEAEIATITAPFWAVISQECDLLHDYKATIGDYNNQDKCLQTILLCPAYPKEQVEAGIHLQSLSLKMAEWKGKDLDKILQNQNPRFQYLNTIEIQELPDLIIDFKRVYSFPRQYIYAKLGFRVGTLEILYRESLTQRLTNYTSRIGLPDEIVG